MPKSVQPGFGSGPWSGTGSPNTGHSPSTITKKLQQGNRRGVQSMTAVVDLKTGRLFEPQEGSGSGHERIRINKPVFDQLKKVVEILAAAL